MFLRYKHCQELQNPDSHSPSYSKNVTGCFPKAVIFLHIPVPLHETLSKLYLVVLLECTGFTARNSMSSEPAQGYPSLNYRRQLPITAYSE